MPLLQVMDLDLNVAFGLDTGEDSCSESIPSACTYDSSNEDEGYFNFSTKVEGTEISDNTVTEIPSWKAENRPTEIGFESNLELIVEMEAKLQAGVAFGSIKQAHLFYCEYGRQKRFSVRRGDQRYKGRINEIRWN